MSVRTAGSRQRIRQAIHQWIRQGIRQWTRGMLTAGSLMLAASCSRGPACAAVTASATPPEPWLTVSLTETPAELRDRIERDWESRETTDAFAAFIVVRAGDPLFPSDEDLATNADGATDADLRRYRALPADRRTHNLYLVEPTGRRWPSEPHAGGTPLPFRTAFLLHLASAEGADAATAGAARTHVSDRDRSRADGARRPGLALPPARRRLGRSRLQRRAHGWRSPPRAGARPRARHRRPTLTPNP